MVQNQVYAGLGGGCEGIGVVVNPPLSAFWEKVILMHFARWHSNLESGRRDPNIENRHVAMTYDYEPEKQAARTFVRSLIQLAIVRAGLLKAQR